MIDLGRVKPGSTIRFPFGSYTGSTGASSATTNYAAADIQIYKDGGTTQRASASGITATADFDGLTGINIGAIDLSDNTTADFYAAGSEYIVVVADVTIDGQTVRFPAARFVIGMDEAVLDTTIATLASQTSFTLTAGSADNNAYVGCVAYIHDAASAVQCAMGVVSAYTGSTKTVTLAADPGIFTMAAKDNISLFFRSSVHAFGGAAVTARDIGASVLLSSGTGTGQLDFTSGVAKANVTQYGGSSGTFASGRPEVNMTHIAGSAVSTTSAQLGVNVVQLSGDATAADNAEAFFDGTGYAGTNNVIPTVTTVNGLAANVITAAATAADFGAEIADAVWDEATSGHTTAGTTGKALTDAGSAGDPWGTALPGAYGAGTAGKIIGDNINATVSSRASQTTADAIETDTQDIQTRLPAALSSTGFMKADFLAIGSLALVSGTSDAGGSTTTMVDAARTEADDYWNGAYIYFTSGAVAGQSFRVTDFVASSDTFTFSPAAAATIGSGINYVILNIVNDGDGATVLEIATGVRDELSTELGVINTITAEFAALPTASEINAEVVDALNVDTYAEPGQASPGANVSLATKINYLYKAWRNKKTQSATEFDLYADDGTTVDQKSTVSDSGTVMTRGEIVSGP